MSTIVDQLAESNALLNNDVITRLASIIVLLDAIATSLSSIDSKIANPMPVTIV